MAAATFCVFPKTESKTTNTFITGIFKIFGKIIEIPPQM
jgi:hypothetical protein